MGGSLLFEGMDWEIGVGGDLGSMFRGGCVLLGAMGDGGRLRGCGKR